VFLIDYPWLSEGSHSSAYIEKEYFYLINKQRDLFKFLNREEPPDSQPELWDDRQAEE
jgi:hypothetical protein